MNGVRYPLAGAVLLRVTLAGAQEPAMPGAEAHAPHAMHATISQPDRHAAHRAAADTAADGHVRSEHADKDHADAHRDGAHPAGTQGADIDHAGMRHADMHDEGADAAAPEDAEARVPSGHVAPPPPQHEMAPMSVAEMVDVMGMDDRARYGLVAFDRFEAAHTDAGTALVWSARATYGGDVDRLWLRSEGERLHGRTDDADVELLWGHAIAPYWDAQAGVRRDVGRGRDRTWAAFGVQGLAPYWFEVSATAYLGEQGRTALRTEVDYELLLGQRLVLQPRVELNAYGRDDRAAGDGAGLSDAAFGLRLRYEIRREFAPYIGVERRWRLGGSADVARADGDAVAETQWVAGVRFWF